ncbi:mitochondrial carrier domain-containing protein [Astrocystis sublimbata]|nr:mitochondrial carrier domain-containing protein [Astrocystis sublimbata]
MSPSSSSPPLPNPNSILPALHHASSGSLGTLISTCGLYPLSLVIARLQVQRQLRRRSQGRGCNRSRTTLEEDPTGRARTGPEEKGESYSSKSSNPTASPGVADPTGPRTSPAPTSRIPGDRLSSPTQTQTLSGQEQRQQQHPPVVKGKEEDDEEEERREEEYAGIVDAFSRIWRSDGGLRAFYTGLAQDATKSVLDSFLFFLFYEWFRALRLKSRRRRGAQALKSKGRGLGWVEELAVGMAAGACSRFFTTPIANVVTRKQTATLTKSKSKSTSSPDRDDGKGDDDDNSVREIVRRIREEKGIAGFWSGFSASLVLTLNPSLTFFLQEALKTTFAEQTYDDPGPRLTFLFAASSKAVSSFVTYPFQIAKTRLQAGIPLDTEDEDQGQDMDEKGSGEHEEMQSESGKILAKTTTTTTTTAAICAVQNLAQRSIFGTVAQLIRSEGLASLYDGVGAELVKGFFSHGTTMLAKDVVHKALFKLYLLVVGVLVEMKTRPLSRTMLARREQLFRALIRNFVSRP